MTRRLSALTLAAAVACASACHQQSPRPAESAPQVAYRSLGTWSGHGNGQTESFDSTTGALRVRWQTRPFGGASGGAFHLEAHSAISGRLLQIVGDQPGPGSGEGVVQADPHTFYLLVEADRLDWTVVVDEAVLYR